MCALSAGCVLVEGCMRCSAFLDDNTYVFIWVRHLLSSCCEVFRLLGVILAGIVCVSKSVCVDRVSGKQSVV